MRKRIGEVRGGSGDAEALDIGAKWILDREILDGEIGICESIVLVAQTQGKLGHAPSPCGTQGAGNRMMGGEKVDGLSGAVNVGDAGRNGSD